LGTRISCYFFIRLLFLKLIEMVMLGRNIFLVLITCCLLTGVQSQTNNALSLKSAGLDIGLYNPELDYWKNESQFKDADFTGAFHAGGFVELNVVSDLSARFGLGFWQQTADGDLDGFGETTWSLTGFPISLDLIYYATPLGFSVVTPFVGAGGEYLPLQQKLRFDQKDDPDPVNGSTALFRGILGFDVKLSEQFAVDIDFTYKSGNYTQDFISFESIPDSNELIEKMITEEISLSGPKFGITLKYLF